MTYRGEVRNGQIVLEPGARLQEGAMVQVTTIELPHAEAGTAEAVLSSPARWHGTDDEAERLLEEMRWEKWAEVEARASTIGRGAVENSRPADADPTYAGPDQ